MTQYKEDQKNSLDQIHEPYEGRVPHGIIVSDKESKLPEAIALWESLGGKVIETYVFHIRSPHHKYYLGPGQLQSIKIEPGQILYCDVSINQANRREIEKLLKVKVWDRTEVVLRIFNQRAITAEGKLQVQLANLMHQKRKLVGAWTHLERQRGQTSHVSGPGELQKELDRRLLEWKIQQLKKQIENIKKHRKIRRKENTVAIVGYTNVGKTAALRLLSHDKEIASCDQLFATLDPKSRFWHIGDGNYVTIVDTVGFISDLPHILIDAFHSTLEESKHADIVLHLHDVSDQDYIKKGQVVRDTLQGLGVNLEHVINIWNKIDLVSDFVLPEDGYCVSSLTGQGWDIVRDVIKDKYFAERKIFIRDSALIPRCIECVPVKNGYLVTLKCKDEEWIRLRAQIKESNKMFE